MDDQKQQLIDKLKSATNILVTVSSNPSVDQLAACIGLTISLNKLDKHATAVFSGDVPETIEFLKPEETLEKNTDSLRDFIIALDKTKADKLRYKVEDKVVKIFITPYRTSITEEDLDFSQGDFNVDVVVALGVQNQQDLDQAITAHGRILHDATVVSLSTVAGGELGSMSWVDTNASSLSESVAKLTKQLDKKLIDEQIATALLTGIVAATDRFRNENTTAETMSISADLMAAGANQQLVTSELEHAVDIHDHPEPKKGKKSKPDGGEDNEKPEEHDGTLEISHAEPPAEEKKADNTENGDTPPEERSEAPPEISRVHSLPDEGKDPEPYREPDLGRDVMTEPPTFGSALTANDKQKSEGFQAAADLGSNGSNAQLLTHDLPDTTKEEPPATLPTPSVAPDGTLDVTPPRKEETFPPVPTQGPAGQPPVPPLPPSPPTLNQQPYPAPTPPSVPPQTYNMPPTEGPAVSAASSANDGSPQAATDVDAAREEVMRALSEQPNETLPPIAALNAQPLGDNLHPSQNPPSSAGPQPIAPPSAQMPPPLPPQPDLPPAPQSPADQPMDMPLPPSGGGFNVPPPQPSPPTNSPNSQSPNSPPPVPPPMMPPSWPGPQQ